jgi:hypothetical protein
MQFRAKSTLVLLLFVMVPHLSRGLKAQDYAIEEMGDEETMAIRSFSIAQVVPFDGGLRLFLSTDNPEAVAKLLSAGELQAQLSDHQSETAAEVSLSFGKAVWCSEDEEPAYMAFADPLPSCDNKPPVRIEYFLEAGASLGPGRDLAIGQDPDFLWLIEER